MKTRIAILFALLSLLLGGCTREASPAATEPAADPIWGKGYAVSFNAYTCHSGHPSSDPIYCLTENQHFIYADTTWDAALEAWEFDAVAFTALFTDFGYWQDKFSPEYICENIDCAWKGSIAPEVACYLLKLKDGMLMLAYSTNNLDSNYCTGVQILEEKGTQKECFSFWNDKWLPRQFEDDKTPYEKWQELYHKYT